MPSSRVAPEPSPSIPLDRPVLGGDLETLQAKLNISVMRCASLLGIDFIHWSKLKAEPEKAIPNPTIALLVRLFDHYPQLVEPEPTPEDLHELIEKKLGRPLSLKHLAVMLGRHKSAGSRWKRGNVPNARVTALVVALMSTLERWPKGALCHFTELVGLEAGLRGVDDIWKEARWGMDPDVDNGDELGEDGGDEESDEPANAGMPLSR